MTNNFYDKADTYSLPVKELVVEGEIADPGRVDFADLPKRSVIVKEALPEADGSNRFTGAFRYDGYSLFDIIDKRVIKKANEAEYSSIIDLYLIIENDEGEKKSKKRIYLCLHDERINDKTAESIENPVG